MENYSEKGIIIHVIAQKCEDQTAILQDISKNHGQRGMLLSMSVSDCAISASDWD